MRQKGYYWIKRNQQSNWQVGHWDGTVWTTCGSQIEFKDVLVVESIQIQRFENAGKKGQSVFEKLEQLGVGQTLPIKQFIQSIWGDYDDFIRRSFDVMYSAAKKKLPTRHFQVVRGEIKRII